MGDDPGPGNTAYSAADNASLDTGQRTPICYLLTPNLSMYFKIILAVSKLILRLGTINLFSMVGVSASDCVDTTRC